MKRKSVAKKAKEAAGWVLFTTDGVIDPGIKDYCLEVLKRNVAGRYPIVEIQNPPGVGRSYAQLFKNYLEGLKHITGTGPVFIADQDTLYPADYFDVPEYDPAKLIYTRNMWYLDKQGFYPRIMSTPPLSMLVTSPALLKKTMEGKLARVRKDGKINWVEPGLDDGFENLVTFRDTSTPVVDIRYGNNTSGDRKTSRHVPLLEPWGYCEDIWGVMEGRSTLPPAKPERKKARQPVKPEAQVTPEVSFVIITRDEPEMLKWTISNLQRTAPGNEVIVVFDGFQEQPELPAYVRRLVPWAIPLGVGPCRNVGIHAAKNNFVVLLDTHMDFEDGWLEPLLEPVLENNKTISCSRSAVLRPGHLDLASTKKINHGARIEWSNEKNYPFEPVWHYHPPRSEVQTVLGACYCLCRHWYITGLHSPWANAFGWGTSEQLISIVNWFCGGRQILADCTTGHVYYDRSDSKPYKHSEMNLAGKWYNRCRAIDLLPLDDERKKGLIDCVMNRTDARQFRPMVEHLFVWRDDSAIIAAIKYHGRTFEEYAARWYPEGLSFPLPQQRRASSPPPRQSRREVRGNAGRNPFEVALPECTDRRIFL